jgi:hypothetical protein
VWECLAPPERDLAYMARASERAQCDRRYQCYRPSIRLTSEMALSIPSSQGLSTSYTPSFPPFRFPSHVRPNRYRRFSVSLEFSSSSDCDYSFDDVGTPSEVAQVWVTRRTQAGACECPHISQRKLWHSSVRVTVPCCSTYIGRRMIRSVISPSILFTVHPHITSFEDVKERPLSRRSTW